MTFDLTPLEAAKTEADVLRKQRDNANLQCAYWQQRALLAEAVLGDLETLGETAVAVTAAIDALVYRKEKMQNDDTV